MVNKQGLTILIVGMCLAHLLVGVGHSQTQVNADIRESTVWTLAASPYLIERNVAVVNGQSLTIQPGVVVRVERGASLTVSRGSLKALGTASQPIRFTSAQLDPAPGDWGAVRFDYNTDSANTSIENCVFEYGGGGRAASIEIVGSSPTIREVFVSRSGTSGIAISKSIVSGSPNPIITLSRFSQNALAGILIQNSASESSALIKNNIFESNGYYPIICDANTVGNIQSNVFLDNRYHAILVAGGTLRSSARIFNLGIPFVVSAGPIVIDGYEELFIDPGVVLRFNSGTGIVARHGAALRALGESHNPIIFTSSQESPSRGDWQGIYIYDRTISSSLEFCIIEYGGQGGNGNVYIRRGSPTITNCVIRQSSNDGVIINSSWGSDANPVISQNNIYENARFGINNESTRQVTARNNWWGSAGGAQSIKGGVDTASHLLSPILIGFPRSPWLQLFPHFAAGLGWKSFLFLQNVEEIDTSVDVSFYGGDGLPEQVTIAAVTGTEFSVEVPRQGSKSLEITSGRLASGWIELLPRQKVNSSLVFQFEAEGAVAATAGVPAAQLGEEFRITFRSSAATGNRVGVALANPNNDPIRVRMELFRSSGQFFSDDDLELPSWGHLASFVDELFPAAAAWDGYVKLSSDLGFIVVPLKIDGSLISTIAASKIR